MLALSIVAPNGSRIAAGNKTLEIRSWQPPRWPLRDLLIVENRILLTGDDQVDRDGIAVALVDVEDVHAWQPDELDAACWDHWQPDLWAWEITRVRPLYGTLVVAARRKIYEAQVSDALRDCVESLPR
ncbi:ASCH domain-containing protein [Rhodanobacter sp. AS-Z3]|uniref:ASCH domain-containing protein n=1 Tax=Rhodanobacter sp. AS-Z3 TaxID=3031330 RepID=UPI002479C516|nr:ASCH domain-containing protein [Rhodanobacter sp. AS-Z3]WEN15053.1 ASCH domain-containing protein [Rhodanobacter sp. AS-Z3]